MALTDLELDRLFILDKYLQRTSSMAVLVCGSTDVLRLALRIRGSSTMLYYKESLIVV